MSPYGTPRRRRTIGSSSATTRWRRRDSCRRRFRRRGETVDVIVVVDGFAGGERGGGREAIAAGIAGTMRGAVIDGGVVVEGPEVLHDVDFAACGPRDRGDVFAQHPEGGPDTLAEGKLDAGLDPAVLPAQIGGLRGGSRRAGLQAGRGVIAAGIADGANHQIALAVLKDVVRRVGVGLRFTIAPATPAQVVVPLRSVRLRAGGPVELVAPKELPGGLRRGRSCGEQNRGCNHYHGAHTYILIF